MEEITGIRRYFGDTQLWTKTIDFTGSGKEQQPSTRESMWSIYSIDFRLTIQKYQLIYIDEDTGQLDLLEDSGNLIKGDPLPDTPEWKLKKKELIRQLDDGEEPSICIIRCTSTDSKDGRGDIVKQYLFLPDDEVGSDDNEEIESYDDEDEENRRKDKAREEEWRRNH